MWESESKKKKVFLACAGSTRGIVREAAKLVKARGHEVFNWWDHPLWGTDLTLPQARLIAKADRQAVRECDCLIWLLDPDVPSCGAPWEVGYASALEKPICTLFTAPIPENWGKVLYASLKEADPVTSWDSVWTRLDI